MKSRLTLGNRIMLTVMGTAALAVVVALIGVLGVRSLLESSRSSAGTISANLDAQSSQLVRRREFEAALRSIESAKTKPSIDAVLAGLGTSTVVGGMASNQFTSLAEGVTRVGVSRAAGLDAAEKIAAAEAALGVLQKSMEGELARLVDRIETEALAQSRKSVETTSAGSTEQKAATQTALKLLSDQTDRAIKTVTTVLQARSAGASRCLPWYRCPTPRRRAVVGFPERPPRAETPGNGACASAST